MESGLEQQSRRVFLKSAVALGSGLMMSKFAIGQESRKEKGVVNEICCFEKPVQWMEFEQLADTLAEAGYDGIEATVRDGGHVLPERVEEDLPKLVDALKKRNLKVQVMASSINDANHPLTEKVLKTAAGLGVERYRLKYFKYAVNKPLPDQVKQISAKLAELASLNAEIGIQGVYQNHSGRDYFGAPVWDLHSALQGINPKHLGVAFDIRHATVEGGTCWPLHFQLVRPHLGIVYAKDFTWDGRRAKNVPLGQGQVDPKFFDLLKQSKYRGPISVHVEYHHAKDTEQNPQPVIDDIRRDRQTLVGWLK
ncbi:MAG: TIM barrel protein [Planctomycetes bacterium]|nr:TIM barrel protein [Planctomycetota bacterium]